MKNSKWITAAAVLTLSASLAVAAPQGDGFGGKHGRHGKHGRGDFGGRFAQKLNLTDAQKAQIKQLNEQFRTENKAFFQQTRDTRRQLHEAKKAGDQARLAQLKATADSQRAQMKQLRDAQEARIASILTAEQRQQWETLKAERKARGEKHGNKLQK